MRSPFAALALAFVLMVAVAPTASAQAGSRCPAGQQPRFVFGFAALHDRLGDWMGSAVTCEFADPNGTGDVHQQTSKGLSFWRKSTNTPTFTNGSEHWALSARGFVYWQGSSIDPPANAVAARPNLGVPSAAAAPPPPSPPRPPSPPPPTPAAISAPGAHPRGSLWCQVGNASCKRDPWWVEWNEQQDGSLVQYPFIGPGLITEKRFVEVVWLLWEWPEGRSLLKQAADNEVAIISAVGGEDAGSFAYYRPSLNIVVVNRTFAETSTWMIADVIAHELKHAADFGAGILTGNSYGECIAREQRGYEVEYRYQGWLTGRFGRLPAESQILAARLSEEDYNLYLNLYRLGTSANVDALAANDYRGICA